MAYNEDENIYRGVGFDAYGAGKEARNQVQNLQDFGSTVGRIGRGVAAMPGQTLEGMRSAAAPYMDRQFAAMEAQGRGVRQGFSDFGRGFSGDNSAPVAQGVPAPTHQPSRPQGVPDRAAPAAGGDGSDIRGWAARNNPNPKSFSAGTPTPGNDAYRQMADQLYGISQQRAGTEGSIGVEGYQQQLNNIRALNDSTPMGGFAALPDYAAQQNAEFDRRNAIDPTGLSKREVARLNVQLQKDRTDQRGQDMVSGVGYDRNRIAEQGQNLSYRGQLETEGLRGRNQLAVQGLQGRNQLANTQLGYGLQGQNQQALEDARFDRETTLQDRRFANDAPYREAQAQSALNHGRFYGAQADSLDRQAEFDKTADASIQKWAKLYIDSGADPQTAIKEATRMYLGSKRQAEAKYAEGGVVDPKVAASQKLLLEMQQKYGGAAPSTPQPVAPVPAPQPVQQQPRQETWAEKARRIGTGGLDKRMEGYAWGGPIAVGGRQVLGSGTGKSDSLPAEIDGEHPAALSTGEFVMPVEAVRHFGLDRLNKMVAAARKGLATDSEAA